MTTVEIKEITLDNLKPAFTEDGSPVLVQYHGEEFRVSYKEGKQGCLVEIQNPRGTIMRQPSPSTKMPAILACVLIIWDIEMEQRI